MCGITAIHTTGRPILRGTLEAALARIRHRGPDGDGYWLAPDAQVGLAHARLSLVDLATGQQPMANEDDTVHAIVNGEFYDYARIQRDLRGRGHHLRSHSDSEILIHLYEEEGTACLRHLRGEFAFVLWDARRRRLFAARDRFGIKPLFHGRAGEALVLASEVKALFAAGVPAAWAPDALHRALFFFPGRSQTLFDGVHQVPPGHWLTCEADAVRIEPYWDLDYPVEPDTRTSEADHVSAVRASLEEATRLRLMADVPVGCLLSGGLDSAALLGIATRMRPPSAMPTFTAAFPDLTADDRQATQEAATASGVTLVTVPVSEADLADGLSAAVWHAETLGINLHGVGRLRLCEQVHHAGLRAVLTGEGADELFGGYIQFRQDAAAAPFAIGQAGRDCVPPALAGVQARLGFVPGWMQKIAVRDSVFHALLAPDYAASVDGQDPFEASLDEFDLATQLHGRHPLQQSLYLWARTVLPHYILVAERLEMAHAVEVRLPYLDHLLFEQARTLGADLLLRDGQEKYALREAVRPFVPPSIARRSKQPFLAPPAMTVSGSPLHAVARETLHGDALASLPFFDRDILLALFDSLPAQAPHVQSALDAALMKVVSIALLQQQFRLAVHG